MLVPRENFYYLACSITSRSENAGLAKLLAEALAAIGYQPTAPHIFDDEPRKKQAKELGLSSVQELYLNTDPLVLTMDERALSEARFLVAIFEGAASDGRGYEICRCIHCPDMQKPVFLIWKNDLAHECRSNTIHDLAKRFPHQVFSYEASEENITEIAKMIVWQVKSLLP